MNNRYSVIPGLFAAMVTLAYSASTMSAGDFANTVAPNSLTVVSKARGASVEIRLGSAALCASAERQEVFITGMTIRVGDSFVLVPRSAYADLVAPTYAKVEFSGATGILVIRGGDGADAYSVKLFFDRKRVSRRTVASALLANQPSEDTRYLLRILKDE